jgi:hypothetical protein
MSHNKQCVRHFLRCAKPTKNKPALISNIDRALIQMHWYFINATLQISVNFRIYWMQYYLCALIRACKNDN